MMEMQRLLYFISPLSGPRCLEDLGHPLKSVFWSVLISVSDLMVNTPSQDALGGA